MATSTRRSPAEAELIRFIDNFKWKQRVERVRQAKKDQAIKASEQETKASTNAE